MFKSNFRIFFYKTVKPKWIAFLDSIRKLFMLFTFIGIIVGFLFLVYYAFFNVQFTRVLTMSVFIFICIGMNRTLQD